MTERYSRAKAFCFSVFPRDYFRTCVRSIITSVFWCSHSEYIFVTKRWQNHCI